MRRTLVDLFEKTIKNVLFGMGYEMPITTAEFNYRKVTMRSQKVMRDLEQCRDFMSWVAQ